MRNMINALNAIHAQNTNLLGAGSLRTILRSNVCVCAIAVVARWHALL